MAHPCVPSHPPTHTHSLNDDRDQAVNLVGHGGELGPLDEQGKAQVEYREDQQNLSKIQQSIYLAKQLVVLNIMLISAKVVLISANQC